MKLNYRADIDGLRAVAVLAVVLNHAGIAYFSGGYIGVDIFFVISGFLITAIIAREIQEDSFTLSKFYERRIRRILPALVGMVVFTLFVSALIYDSGRFMAFAKSLIATMLFYSNINFWNEAGYFDTTSLLKPLLHTWSLAVEEQFYIVFPLLMYVINIVAKKSVKLILFIIALFSLGLAIYTVNILNVDAISAFYLAHMRAWELLMGAMLALNVFPVISNKAVNSTLGIAGMVMIGFPIFNYTEHTAFPGLNAILPVLGTALIIYSSMSGNSWVGKILGFPPLVFIGKISYSLYLWHWPLIIFVKYYLILPLTNAQLSVLLVVILAVSTLSWRFIESPFRSKKFLSTRQIFAFAAITMTAIVLTAGAVYKFEGFPKREGYASLDDYVFKEQESYTECIYPVTNFKPCALGDKSQPVSFMLVGDSHAHSLRKAVNLVARNDGFAGTFMYKNACPPLLTLAHDKVHSVEPCNEYTEGILQYLESHPEIKTVILVGRWSFYVEGYSYKSEDPHGVDMGYFFDNLPLSSNAAFVKLGLEQMIQALLKMNRKIVIVSPVPEIGYDVPSANFIASRTGRDINKIIAPSLNEYQDRSQKVFTIFSELKERYDFQVVDPWTILCVDNVCRVTFNGILLYSDDDHLSSFGSELISPIFEPVFASMKQ